MTSSNLITSLASMTLTAFLTSKKSKTASFLHTAWFSWQQEPQQPQWPQQPQEPQWPQWPQQPLFIKKLGELDDSINPSTKMTYPGLSMWNGSSKIHYFIDFWHSFYLRLWRPCVLFSTKAKGHKSIAIKLETCWKPWNNFKFIRTYSNIEESYRTLPRKTLYPLCHNSHIMF